MGGVGNVILVPEHSTEWVRPKVQRQNAEAQTDVSSPPPAWAHEPEDVRGPSGQASQALPSICSSGGSSLLWVFLHSGYRQARGSPASKSEVRAGSSKTEGSCWLSLPLVVCH